MDELYKFVEVLLEQTNLLNQLDVSVTFSTTNWKHIKDDLDKKNKILQKITGDFPNVNSADYAFTFKDGLAIAATTIVLGFMSYNFVSGYKKTKVSKSSSEFNSFFN
jgi:hypothetical protein